MAWSALLTIMLPPRGQGWGVTEVNGIPVGAVISVYPDKNISGDAGAALTGYVRVTGIPDTITLIKLRNVLRAPVKSEDKRSEVAPRMWLPSVSSMVEPGKGALLTNRFIETTWDRLKQLSRNAVDNRLATDADFA